MSTYNTDMSELSPRSCTSNSTPGSQTTPCQAHPRGPYPQPKPYTRFTDDTDMSCFVVAKNGYDLGSDWVQGEIPRRGNSFELIVRHEPQGATYAAPKVATLVVDQEDGWKWTYKIIAST